MRQRVITGFFFVLAMLGGIYGGFWPFCILFGIITTGCLWEFYQMTLPNEGAIPVIRRVVTTLLAAAPYWYFITAHSENELANLLTASVSFASVLLIMALLGPLVQLFTTARLPFANMGQALFGVLYITLPFFLLFDIAVDPTNTLHPNRVLGLLLLTWTNDTLAYVIGSRIGKYKLLPRISPKKTWEGTIGGAVCTLVIAFAMGKWIFPNDFTLMQWLAVGGITAIFATLGDLVESMLKRSAGVKDSGNLLPGHGGLLDRFDAFIVVLPFAWLVLKILAP
jgi:phosphatidate cytidylyltransferase